MKTNEAEHLVYQFKCKPDGRLNALARMYAWSSASLASPVRSGSVRVIALSCLPSGACCSYGLALTTTAYGVENLGSFLVELPPDG